MKTKPVILLLVFALLASGAGNLVQWQQNRVWGDKYQTALIAWTKDIADHAEKLKLLHQPSADDKAKIADLQKELAESEKVQAAYLEQNEKLAATIHRTLINLSSRQAVISDPPPAPVATVLRRAAYNPPLPPAPPTVDLSRVSAAVQRQAEQYYSDGRKNGSGQTLVFGLAIELDEPRAVPGWTNRYEVKGSAHYNYYDSIWGGSFTSERRRFTAQVEGSRVVDFTPGF